MITLHPSHHRRTGFTLLEVLVACGILVVALASIAAILPAAASRLGDATAMDRGNALDAMAFSEIQSRGLATRDVFTSPASAAGVVIGDILPSAVLTTVTNSGYGSVTLFSGTLTATGASLTSGSGTLFRNGVAILTLPNWTTLNTRADVSRGFSIEDDVQYLPPTSTLWPVNRFAGVSASSGYRQFNRGVSWGAVLTPEPWGTTSGSMTAVRASVAIFRKPSTAVAMTLTRSGAAGSSLFTSGTTIVPAAIQRTRLRPCSFVLALPPTSVSGTGPQWLGIRSSWMSGTSSQMTLDALTSGSAQACVVFERPIDGLVTSGSLTVLTFDSLLLTDQKVLPVQ
jgi:hypothetical protein